MLSFYRNLKILLEGWGEPIRLESFGPSGEAGFLPVVVGAISLDCIASTEFGRHGLDKRRESQVLEVSGNGVHRPPNDLLAFMDFRVAVGVLRGKFYSQFREPRKIGEAGPRPHGARMIHMGGSVKSRVGSSSEGVNRRA